MMLAADEAQIDLDAASFPLLARISRPARIPTCAQKITVRKLLLLHTSGLPAHRAFLQRRNASRRSCAHEFSRSRLVAAPGTKIEYSDLGFILLGEIVERLTGEILDRVRADYIFEPLGMAPFIFQSAECDCARNIAPTENDTDYRERLLRRAKWTTRTRWRWAASRGMQDFFSHGRRPCGVCANDAQWRNLRAATDSAARNYRAIHAAR